jgi:hypothetical protein
MYTINLYRGTVTRNNDNKVVAPCDSEFDPDFLEYIAWVNSGNSPIITDGEPA